MIGVLFAFGVVIAAPVTLTVTIPDTIDEGYTETYVERLTTMVQAEYIHPGNFSCTGLTIKECFTKVMVIEPVKKLLLQWERARDRKAARISADAGVKEIEMYAE